MLNVRSDHPNNTGPVSGAAQVQSVGLSVPSQNDMGIDPSVLSHQPTSGSFHPSLSADPLQNELDNLCRKAEQLDNDQKDMKSRLSHDCEKEIEEAIAQIRKKYELKYQEGDAEYQSKKREVEKNQKKIYMNQVLAAVFRYKCSDQVRQPVARSSSLQHIHQLSTQPSAGPPQQTTQPSRAHLIPRSSTLINPTVRSSTIINPSSIPTVISSTLINPSSISSVRSPTIMNQNVPPHIGTITPNRNPRSGEIRSAAPHLQSLRSASGPQARGVPIVSAAEDLPEIRSMFGSLELSDLETIAGDGR